MNNHIRASYLTLDSLKIRWAWCVQDCRVIDNGVFNEKEKQASSLAI